MHFGLVNVLKSAEKKNFFNIDNLLIWKMYADTNIYHWNFY